MFRPVTNLERILASINFKEDEVIHTPEPLLGAVEASGRQRTGSSSSSAQEGQDKMESPILSPFTSRSASPISDEDVPLTVELLTPRVRQNSVSGYGQFGLCSMLELGPPAFYETQSEEETEKRSAKRQLYLETLPKKNGLPFKLSASSESLLKCEGGTSDGLDDYQEGEKDNGAIAIRLKNKKKTKKRHGSKFKNALKKRAD